MGREVAAGCRGAAVVVQGPPIQNHLVGALGPLPILFIVFSKKVVVLLGCVFHRESACVRRRCRFHQLQGEGGL